MISISPSGHSAEGKGFEPSSLEENRVSSAVRPTVSGYLPYFLQWTHRELNPDFRHAMPASSRWTTGPITLDFTQRSVRELNPIFRLTKAACCRNTYRPSRK